MHSELIAIGGKMPAWVETACQEYLKRLKHPIKLALKTLPLAHRGKNTSREQAMAEEAKSLFGAISPHHYVIALDKEGKQYSTEALASRLTYWQERGQPIAFLLGGPDGFTKEILKRANDTWSLSKLTYPHPLARVIVIEQLYRAQCILSGHPYHK